MFELLIDKSLTLGDTFTAAYNAIRVLQYRNRVHENAYADFLRQHDATTSEKTIKVALRLIHEIEEREQTPVSELDGERAQEYELALASLTEKRAREEVPYDPIRAKQLLSELEKDAAIR